MRSTLPATVALAVLAAGATGAAAQSGFTHPFAFPQPDEGADFFAVIEIPAGGITKYEIDGDTGHVFVDRYMSMPVAYPANYGSIPSSLGGDGDPLDALVLSREPIAPGVLIKVRAIGVLDMIDGGETDDKIVAVPASDIDPSFDGITGMDDLPEMERNRIEGFFRVYKQLPDPADAEAVELGGFRSAEEAAEIVATALDAYRDAPAN
jgi:inorganic pyrophosphatase